MGAHVPASRRGDPSHSEGPVLAKRAVTALVRDLGRVEDPRLRANVQQCIQLDIFASPRIDRIRSAVGAEYEYVLQQCLLNRGVTFLTETQQRCVFMCEGMGMGARGVRARVCLCACGVKCVAFMPGRAVAAPAHTLVPVTHTLAFTHALTRTCTYRQQQRDKTPDALLCVPMAISGPDGSTRIVTWIDSKAMFGDMPPVRPDSAAGGGGGGDSEARQKMDATAQAVSYTNRYGPGLVIFWFNFVAALHIPDVCIMSAFPAHVLTCGDEECVDALCPDFLGAAGSGVASVTF
jgi:hypothetical protein